MSRTESLDRKIPYYECQLAQVLYLRLPAIKYIDIKLTALAKAFRESFRHDDVRHGVFKD